MAMSPFRLFKRGMASNVVGGRLMARRSRMASAVRPDQECPVIVNDRKGGGKARARRSNAEFRVQNAE
jgi:hypothetical protein